MDRTRTAKMPPNQLCKGGGTMNNHILVCYASGSGSTKEVAEAVADVLAERGARTTVMNVMEVQTLEPYEGVVVGSSIRAGHWLPEAAKFVADFRAELRLKKVAYFTMCLTMLNDEVEGRKRVLAYMQPILAVDKDIEPVGLGLFCGSMNPALKALVPNEVFGDHRNWEAIKDWAYQTAGLLMSGEPGLVDENNMRGAVLSYTDLSYSDLHRMDLGSAHLDHSDLSAADLHGARLNWAELDESQLAGANLEGANLIGVKLDGANLQGANLREAVLNGAALGGVDLRDCDLRQADLNWADLSGADLSGSDLTGAALGWASLLGANLSGAKLAGAQYNSGTEWPEGFDPAAAGCVNFGDAHF